MDQFFIDCFNGFRELHDDCEASIVKLPQEALDWMPGEEMNSTAVLAVHLTGAERYWIGDVAMQEPSGRQREKEFLVRDMSVKDLLGRLETSRAYIWETFERLRVEELAAVRVSPRDGRSFTVGWAIQHALAHTALHTGHIQITYQLWEIQRADRA